MEKNKIVEIPKAQWVDFINVIYVAIQHISITKENAPIMSTLHEIVRNAFKDGEVLVVDGKIVDRDEVRYDSQKGNLVLSNKKGSNS